MGASSWRYYTSHRPDPEQALQELRRDVFARGEYSFGLGGFAGPGGPLAGAGGVPPGFAGLPGDPAQVLAAAANLPGPEGRVMRAAMTGDFTGLSAEERQMAEQIQPLFQMAAAGGFADDGEDEDGEGFPPGHRPETIEELLEMVAEDGTHSVLDIERTGPHRGFGVAAPMPAARVAECFGTDRPTCEQVEEHWLDAAEELDRWEAYYLTVYRNGKAHQYAFIGCSGD
jgi:hypothetical protein